MIKRSISIFCEKDEDTSISTLIAAQEEAGAIMKPVSFLISSEPYVSSRLCNRFSLVWVNQILYNQQTILGLGDWVKPTSVLI